MPYYSRDLALVHARGYGQHADRCAPGILELLAPVSGGLILELGCGSGALTRHLLAAGHRVIATDASADMLSLALARGAMRSSPASPRSAARGRDRLGRPRRRRAATPGSAARGAPSVRVARHHGVPAPDA